MFAVWGREARVGIRFTATAVIAGGSLPAVRAVARGVAFRHRVRPLRRGGGHGLHAGGLGLRPSGGRIQGVVRRLGTVVVVVPRAAFVARLGHRPAVADRALVGGRVAADLDGCLVRQCR